MDQCNASLDLQLANLNQKVSLVPINKNGNIFMLPYELGLLILILQIKILKFKEETTPCLTLGSRKPGLELMFV